jgi:hypothetical protein
MTRLDDSRFCALPDVFLKSKSPTGQEFKVLAAIFGTIKTRNGKGWAKEMVMSIGYLMEASASCESLVKRTKRKLRKAGVFNFAKRWDGSDVWLYQGIPIDWEEKWDRETKRERKHPVLKGHRITSVKAQNDPRGVIEYTQGGSQNDHLIKRTKEEDPRKRTNREDSNTPRAGFDTDGVPSVSQPSLDSTEPESNGNIFHEEEIDPIPFMENFSAVPQLEPEQYDDLSIWEEIESITPDDYLPAWLPYSRIYQEKYRKKPKLTQGFWDLLTAGHRFDRKHFSTCLVDKRFIEAMFEFINTPIPMMKSHDWEFGRAINVGIVWNKDVVDRLRQIVYWAHGRGSPHQKTIFRDIRKTKLAEKCRMVSMAFSTAKETK